MDEPTELVAVNRECDLKNKFFNIVGMAEEQIIEISNRFKPPLWFIIRR